MYLNDAVLTVHHSFKGLAEDLDVLVKLSGLDFPEDGSPLSVNLMKVQSAVVFLFGQLVLSEEETHVFEPRQRSTAVRSIDRSIHTTLKNTVPVYSQVQSP